MKKGFTLIELLVVVLIIGILSSVALPQYTKAVRKSRAASAWPVLKTLDQAVQVYCLANPGSSDKDLSLLDVSVPASDSNFSYGWGLSCQQIDSPSQAGAVYARGTSSMELEDGQVISLGMRNGKRICGGEDEGKESVTQFCKSLGMTNPISAGADAPEGLTRCGVYPSHNCYTD